MKPHPESSQPDSVVLNPSRRNDVAESDVLFFRGAARKGTCRMNLKRRPQPSRTIFSQVALYQDIMIGFVLFPCNSRVSQERRSCKDVGLELNLHLLSPGHGIDLI